MTNNSGDGMFGELQTFLSGGCLATVLVRLLVFRAETLGREGQD